QRGQTVKLQLTGKNLASASAVKTTAPKVTAKLLPAAKADAAWVELTAAPDAPTGPFDLTLASAAGDSAPQKLIVDDLPQIESRDPNHSAAQATVAPVLPVTFGGKFSIKGEADYFAFDARAGQKVVLDVGAKRFGSKAAVTLFLLDSAGRTIASAEEIDGDPILEAKLPADGRYYVRVTEP